MFISLTIQRVSGLDDFNALVAAYYCLATWFVRVLDVFPILNVQGPNGTGKSQFLALLKRITFRAHGITAARITPAALRDELAKAHEGTAIIEEADQADAVEEYVGLRYSRSTAVCPLKKLEADGKIWRQEEVAIFGPTVVHKRLTFNDPAVEGRSVLIRTVPDITRKYIKADEIEPEVVEGIRKWANDIRESTDLPNSLDIPDDIAPRVVDSYRPLIALASAAGDMEFLDGIWTRLRQASQNLRDGQLYEPGAVVLQALVRALTKEGAIVIKTVPIEGRLKQIIQYDFGLTLHNHQIAFILREHGFVLKRSGGPTAVFPDLRTLVRACDAIGLHDEAVERASAGLRNLQQGNKRIRLQSVQIV